MEAPLQGGISMPRAAPDPFPCYGDPLGHFTLIPWVTSLLCLPFLPPFPWHSNSCSPPLQTAASSPMKSIMQTPNTTWFCNQFNAS